VTFPRSRLLVFPFACIARSSFQRRDRIYIFFSLPQFVGSSLAIVSLIISSFFQPPWSRVRIFLPRRPRENTEGLQRLYSRPFLQRALFVLGFGDRRGIPPSLSWVFCGFGYSAVSVFLEKVFLCPPLSSDPLFSGVMT